MLAAAAVVPAPPLLVPEVGVGTHPVVDELRGHVHDVVTQLLREPPDRVVVVGAAPTAGPRSGHWDWSGFGVPSERSGPALPPALGIGDWLLDQAGWTGVREHVGVLATASSSQCAALGRDLAERSDAVALLVVGGGSACRDEKAPGHFDPRAAAFDVGVAGALRDADTAALLDLDATLASELLAEGRAAWQVLAGAAGAGVWQADLRFDAAPFGVAYLVALWQRAHSSGD